MRFEIHVDPTGREEAACIPEHGCGGGGEIRGENHSEGFLGKPARNGGVDGDGSVAGIYFAAGGAKNPSGCCPRPPRPVRCRADALRRTGPMHAPHRTGPAGRDPSRCWDACVFLWDEMG